MITFYQRTNSTQEKGRLNGHNKKTFYLGNLIELFSLLYVDDGDFPFGNRS